MSESSPRLRDPLLSLIVCTRDRSGFLDACFAAIARLRFEGEWELVVVDNGSADDTAQRLVALSATISAPVRIVYEPRAGLGRARNAGVRASSGELLAFTDDDCYPARDYLKQVVESFADGSLDYIGGRILLHDDGDHAITIRVDTEPIPIPPGTVVATGLIQGANMAFRRHALERIGGFDDALGPGTPFCNDDVDAVARASAAGHTGSYVPGPVVYHHHRRGGAEEIAALWRSYDRGRGAYFAKSIMDSPIRAKVARYWWQSVGVEKPRATMRELEGALDYVLRRLTRRLG
ncbi:MAG: glycosyltransferase family 2 protein [Gemmatimonadota bacterium]